MVDNLARTTALEMDLRLEAAALSEMAENIKGDNGFRVPAVDWRRTSRRVLTTEWIDGIPINDRDRLVAAGHDPKALGLTVIRSFLNHAMRDGFFHADMHQGNLFVDQAGTVVAVDFGIVGRLGPGERRFLAEILHGLITRDYLRTAQVHFDAGYVPPHHSVEVFAQAMRAIGEPIHGRTAEEISMADLLGQLFAYTEVFDMETRPELILLQKTMVVVEGVARGLDPSLNMWTRGRAGGARLGRAEPRLRWPHPRCGRRRRGHGPRARRPAARARAGREDGARLRRDGHARLAPRRRHRPPPRPRRARGRRAQTAALWVIATALAAMAAYTWR